MSKIFFDTVMAGFGLLLLIPVLFVVTVVIFVADGSPVLFRQIRVGKNGRDFVLNKFRTMTVLKDKAQGSFDAGNRERVTRIGAFLRKTKLDELPQLWNVIIGDMSLVGPRPEVRKWVDAYPERWAKILTVKPGITDPAAIRYRDEEELLSRTDNPEEYYRNNILPTKLNLYEEYVRTKSFCGDIGIIIKTILTVLFPRLYLHHQD